MGSTRFKTWTLVDAKTVEIFYIGDASHRCFADQHVVFGDQKRLPQLACGSKIEQLHKRSQSQSFGIRNGVHV
jgi:hypothetical protein